MRTREQRRAGVAFERIKRLENNGAAMAAEYGRYAHKLPILVMQAGLAQALTFAEAKDQKGGAKALLEDLAVSLKEVGLLSNGTWATLSERAKNAPIPEYQRLTSETLAILSWYKRFAKSVLDIEAGDEP